MRKMDEMERHFADQSIKNAYLLDCIIKVTTQKM